MSKAKKLFKKFILIILIITSLIILTGCSNGDDSVAKEKLDQEMKYLDTEIISMSNLLNNISFNNYDTVTKDINDNIDWPTLKSDIAIIQSTWSTIILDLYNQNISSNDILAFSTELDNATVSIKNEDKVATAKNLATLYSYIPKYLESYSADTTLINISKTKSNIINAYSLVEEDKWDDVSNELAIAETNYMRVLNNISENNNIQFNTNKGYILLKEFQNSISTKDKDIFYIKYKNLMEELNIMI